ncbi:MAG TPA: dynamin family protein [Acidimicrobiales bacterium]|nr:dynamin family protein [Acidimicrobiales bacterium]
MSTNSLPVRVAALLDLAAATYAGHPDAEPAISALRARLAEPLRVAVAGRVKAGKSTLLNALVGHGLAAVDSGDCTRHVTWYVHGRSYEAMASVGGELRRVSMRRREDAIDVDLGALDDAEIDRIVVEWPSPRLMGMTLIDTPGLGTLDGMLDARGRAFLLPPDQPSAADAVIYLTRHMHAHDVGFLEAFHDDDAGRPSPVNTIGVVSRADEIGAARLDAMSSAARVADRYARDTQIRRLCQTTVPVAGLLGFGASLLTERDFVLLGRLASAGEDDADALLLSCDRLAARESEIDLSAEDRAHLLDRFGLFGVRLARALIQGGTASTAPALASALRRESGIDDLRTLLATRFAARSGLLKAQAVLTGLEQITRQWPIERDDVTRGIEMVEAGAHELAELQLLVAARNGALDLDDEALGEIDRVVEGSGLTARERLDLPNDASDDDVTVEITRSVERWRRRAEHPLAARATSDAASVMVRSFEGMLAEAGQPAGSSAQLPVPGAI